MARDIPRPTDEQLDQWKQQHGEGNVILLEPDAEGDPNAGSLPVFAFKKPGRAEMGRFIKGSMADAHKALRTLLLDTRLFPEEAVLERLFAEKPGLVIPIGGELQKVVGSNTDFFVKRL